jgi:hypothetical protein
MQNRIGGKTLVFPRAKIVSATEAILNDKSVRSQISPELMKNLEYQITSPVGAKRAAAK